MSFTTPHVSVQWNLKFEFLYTLKDVDLSRYYSQYSTDLLCKDSLSFKYLVQSFEMLKLVEICFLFRFLVTKGMNIRC